MRRLSGRVIWFASIISLLLTAAILLMPTLRAAELQGPGGEIVRRPPNPPVQNIKLGRSLASRIIAQVETEIKRGNQARGESTISAQMDRIISEEPEIPIEKRRVEAVRHYKRALVLNPKEWRAHYGLGNVYSDQGKYNEAIEAYKQALRVKSNNADIYLALGDAYDRNGQRDEALRVYQESIQADPGRADLYMVLGGYYSSQFHNSVKAAKAYEQAVRLDPKDTNARFHLAYSYLQTKRYREAIEQFKIIVPTKSGMGLYDVRYYLGLAYARLGDKNSAMDQYRELKLLQRTDNRPAPWGPGPRAEALLKEIDKAQ
jgi:tetratricopeptide (TPR) repeat protein